MNMIKSGQHARQLFGPILLFEGGFMFRSAFSAFTLSMGRLCVALVTTDGKRGESPGDEVFHGVSCASAETAQRCDCVVKDP